MDRSTILSEFKEREPLLHDFKLKLHILVSELLKENHKRVHQLTSRLKDEISLKNKIIRKDNKYQNVNSITDLVGLRIITYFEDEVDGISEIIKREFNIDEVNSIDKRKKDFDRFGYSSLHYVISLSDTRLALTEYKKFKGLKAEIQIRSILQHAWAEMEHDLGYKNAEGVPAIVKRDFSRISALLETADIEFINLRSNLEKYKNHIDLMIKNNDDNTPILIDNISLNTYIKNSKIVKEIDEKIAKELNVSLNSSLNYDISLRLVFLGVNNILDLDNLLKENEGDIIKIAKVFINKEESSYNGISVFALPYVLVSKTKNKEEILKFTTKFFGTRHSEYVAQKLIDCY